MNEIINKLYVRDVYLSGSLFFLRFWWRRAIQSATIEDINPEEMDDEIRENSKNPYNEGIWFVSGKVFFTDHDEEFEDS